MKRADFFKSIGLGAMAAIVSPSIIKGKEPMKDFTHDPQDWAMVQEEPEEFQELEVDVPEDWVEEEIVWM